MDTTVASLPPAVGTILMQNIGIIEIVSMFSIGTYNALETGLITFDTFKRYRGLYFWSMQVASWGILVHALPAMTRFISQSSNLPISIPFIIGWYAMTTGQAVVLYSRLHLVSFNTRKIRWVLWMIIVNAFILHVPMTVLFFGLNNGKAALARPAAIFDRIQLTGFCIQDLVICGIYLYQTVFFLKNSLALHRPGGRKILIHLICVNVLVILMNILLLVTEYKMHYIQVSFKTVVYSVKLKLEFSVLNRLRSIISTPPSIFTPEAKQWNRTEDMNSSSVAFVHSNTTPGEVRHAPSRPYRTQEQIEYQGSPHKISNDSHHSVDAIPPPPSLSDNLPGHASGWSAYPSVVELSRSQVSAKSDV